MYINNSSSNYGGLGAQWGLTDPPVDPNSYIPKKPRSLSAMDASMLVARQRRTKPLVEKPDNIFWTDRGPTYTHQAKVKGGAKKGLGPPPIPRIRAKVALVRDLPFVDFPPIEAPVVPAAEGEEVEAPKEAEEGDEEKGEGEEGTSLEGFGVYTGKKKYLCVLGLLLLGLYLYNRQ